MRASQTPAGIGSNSQSYGETLLVEELEIALGGDEKVVFHYVKMHLGDYIAGTKEMGLEAEGAYMRFLANLYERGKPFPDDDRLMARVMRLSVRVWKRIRDGLIAVGKIVTRNGCLTNSRFEKERQKRAEEMRQKAAAASARWDKSAKSLPKVSPKLAPNLGQTSSKLEPNEIEKRNEIKETLEKVHLLSRIQNPVTTIVEEDSVISRLTDSALSAKLEAAAGSCLKNPAASPGLLVLSEPRRWLEQGCDLELDVLPAIRGVAARARNIGTWGYFTQAVADAKARRTAPMPAGVARSGTEDAAAARKKLWRGVDVY